MKSQEMKPKYRTHSLSFFFYYLWNVWELEPQVCSMSKTEFYLTNKGYIVANMLTD